ncbi:Deubiquitinase OTUD6B [Frankliniella fusca]|uniref:Deubiquitinase OTUD6B n=1 Tax=Frankliniella fusca TaxID=407009 RepID=A0AAE1HYF7_9NEOP|nr:Deubiquitinase OTUD6B [Frankliniella fusca]
MNFEAVQTGDGLVNVATMRGDGNCLFTAIVHQMNPKISGEDLHNEGMTLRQQVVDHIKSNLPDYKLTILDSIDISTVQYKQKTPKGKIDAFLRNLSNGIEWGGYETLVACSRLKGIEIKVLQEVWNGNVAAAASLIIENQTSKAQPITVVYRLTKDPEPLQKPNPKRNHYDSFQSFIKDNTSSEKNKASHLKKHDSTSLKSVYNRSPSDLSTYDSFVDLNPIINGSEKNKLSHFNKPYETPLQYVDNRNSDSPTNSIFGDFNRSINGRGGITDDYDNDDDDEHLEYYAPGLWETFSAKHKKAERLRWKLRLQKEKDCYPEIIPPFQAQLPSGSQKKGAGRPYHLQQTLLAKYVLFSKRIPQKAESGKANRIKKKILKKNTMRSSSCITPVQENDHTSKQGVSGTVKIGNSDDENNLDSPTSPTNKKNKPKRKIYKKEQRPIGSQITKNNCLPVMIEEAKMSLDNEKPNWRHIMPCIRSHLHGIIGKSYPKSKEYDIISSEFIKEYPCTADADDPNGYQYVRCKIRKSLAQVKFYHGSGRKKRLQKMVAANKGNEQSHITVNEKKIKDIEAIERIERVQP